MHLGNRLLLGFAFVSATVAAFAQSVPSAPYLTLAQRSAFLLTDGGVPAKIGLNPTQQDAVQAAAANHGRVQSKLFSSKSPNDDDIAANDRAFADKVLGILSPAQNKALLKLAIKDVGVNALADKAIAQRLGLTATQTEKIAVVLGDIQDRRGRYDAMVAQGLSEIRPPKTDAERATLHDRQAAVIKSYAAERRSLDDDLTGLTMKAVAVLSASQQALWKAISPP